MTDRNDPFADMLDPPPMDPGAEPRLTEPAFDAECVAFCEKLLSEGQQLCSERIMTHTEKWGLVWRADYLDPQSRLHGRVSRLICWKSPTGALRFLDAMLQEIAPLGRPSRPADLHPDRE